MLSVPPTQAFERWDTLPDELKEFIYSEELLSLLDEIGKKKSLSREALNGLRRFVGYVLFGFLHPDDLSRELGGLSGVSPLLASEISSELNTKAFLQHKEALAKAYSPEEVGLPKAANLAGGPVVLDLLGQEPPQETQTPEIPPANAS